MKPKGAEWFMPIPEDIDRAYKLAYFLVPDAARAEGVMTAAFVAFLALKKGNNNTAPDSILLQRCVFRESESDEIADEQSHKSEPEDLIVRYIKLILNKTYERESRYTALGIGCYMYRYETDNILDLDADFFSPNNIYRVHNYIEKWIKYRFPVLIDKTAPRGTSPVLLREPRSGEETLAYETLQYLTPWDTDCLFPDSPLTFFAQQVRDHSKARCREGGRCEFAKDDGPCRNQVQLQSFGGIITAVCEWARRHALTDPSCVGLARLMREYNRGLSLSAHGLRDEYGFHAEDIRMQEPDDMLRVPDFPDSDGPRRTERDRFNPPPLSADKIAGFQRMFERHQGRSRSYRTGVLQVRVDGEDRARFDPRADSCPPLRVWTGASYLDIYGTDGDGPLLLAAVALYDLAMVEGTHEVTLDSGQRLLFTVFDMDEDGEQFRIQLAYEEAWHALPQALLHNLHSWWNGNRQSQRGLVAPSWRSSLPLGSAARLIFLAGIAIYLASWSVPSSPGDAFLASLYNETLQAAEPKAVSPDDEEAEDAVDDDDEAPEDQDSPLVPRDPNLMEKLTSHYSVE